MFNPGAQGRRQRGPVVPGTPFNVWREYRDYIHFTYLEAQTLAKKKSSFKAFFITQLRHRHCSATIALFRSPDIYL